MRIEFCESGNDIGKYIVSAIGKTEPYLSPRLETQRASELVLSGRTPADLERLRAEILKTGTADIERFADTLAALAKEPGTCVVGGKKPLETCPVAKRESIAVTSDR